MHRIDHSTANTSLPTPDAAGTPGYFRKGDPQSGQAATVVTADFANAIQEEMAYVITQAGITLNKTDNTQLRAAILKMIQDAGKAVVIQSATFEASVTNGKAVRWDAVNNSFAAAIADGTVNNQAVGFADVTNGKVYCYGETPVLFSGLTPGGRYYLSATLAGAITATAPSDKVAVGIAKSATRLLVDIDAASGVQVGNNNTFTAAQRGAVVDLADGAKITPDFNTGNNFRLQPALGGNRTLANPTNLAEGQSGVIYLPQDSTGSRTLTLEWGWPSAGVTLSTVAQTVDALAYYVAKYATAAVTISIASPGVVTWNGHGLCNGQKFQLTTTGALLTGLAAATTYYVKYIDANSFQLTSTRGGAAINTSGSQSGVHTCTAITIQASLAKGVM